MLSGRRYELQARAYPRYRYYREHLVDLVPRFQRLIEAGKLSNCISQGWTKLKQISTVTEEFNQTNVSITVFADDLSLIMSLEPRLTRTNEPDTKKQQRSSVSITWHQYHNEVEKVTHVMVHVITSQDSETLITVKNRLSHLTPTQLRNTVIYNVKEGTSFLYTELEEAKFKVDWENSKQNKLLVRQIEHVLEDGVVEILETIAAYISKFVPRSRMELDKSLSDEVTSQIKSMDLETVVNERSPERQVSLSDPEPVDKDSFTSTGSEQNSNNKNPQLPLSDEERDQIYHKNLTNYLSSKIKNIICNHLSKKYGIPPSLVNEFLNKDFYDYIAELEDLMHFVTLLCWSEVEKNALSKLEYFLSGCVANTPFIIHKTENYIQKQLVILEMLQKMEFEVFGLLQQAKVKLFVDIPVIPKLPVELQQNLLNLKEVTGCGTIYGKLTLHVSQSLTPETKMEVKDLLHIHRYPYGYITELVSERREETSFEHGSETRAKITKDGLLRLSEENPKVDISKVNHLYGTMGCFVNVTNKLATATGDASSCEKSKLHGITCAHCVMQYECDKKVELNVEDTYHEIGHCNGLHLYEPDMFDIAAIEILESKRKSCDLRLKLNGKDENQWADKWTFMKEDPEEMLSVYKWGCASSLTEGVITSNNFKKQALKELEESCKEQNKPFNMSEKDNILIQSKQDVPEGLSLQSIAVQQMPCPPFSMKGDSGSVVCRENPMETDSVIVVSILQGCIIEPSGNPKYSYSSHMRRTLDKLEALHGCTIEPASYQ